VSTSAITFAACDGAGGGGGGGAPVPGAGGGGGTPARPTNGGGGGGGGKCGGGGGGGVAAGTPVRASVGIGNITASLSGFIQYDPLFDGVQWTYLEDAQKTAKAQNHPYAIYFCSGAPAVVAGEGKKAIENFRKANGYTPLPTVFENTLVLENFSAANLNLFVKAPLSQTDPKLIQRYHAVSNTLIVCAPDDEVLAAFVSENCNQTNVVNYLKKSFADNFNAWLSRQPKAAPAQPAVVIAPVPAPAANNPAPARVDSKPVTPKPSQKFSRRKERRFSR